MYNQQNIKWDKHSTNEPVAPVKYQVVIILDYKI